MSFSQLFMFCTHFSEVILFNYPVNPFKIVHMITNAGDDTVNLTCN